MSIAVVTGASSGIGAASARGLAKAGYDVIVGARRMTELQALAEPIGATALPLDVTDDTSVRGFIDHVLEREEPVDVLVNNAGGASGLDPFAEADLARWQAMYDTNVLGVVRMTKGLLPALLQSGTGIVITIGSIAGLESYPGGSGYNAAKHAIRAALGALRQEMVGQPIRLTEIDPGMVETEFSLVRFDGDLVRAKSVYDGLTPLRPDDVAEAVVWAATRPSHVNIDQIIMKPRDQATATLVHRVT